MRKIIFTIIILFVFKFGYTQNEQKTAYPFRVISKLGTELKAEPNVQSKTLAKLKYWNKIDVYYQYYFNYTDTIERTFGNWQKAIINGTEGYIFDGFIVETDSITELKKDFRIMHEGYLCAYPNFDSNIYWYGIYPTKKGDSLIQVEITISKRNIDNNESMQGSEIIVSTNMPDTMASKCLIGSKIPLKEKIFKFNSEFTPKFLYPGERDDIFGKKSLEINAIGNVIDFQDCPVIENYKLRLIDKYGTHIIQDITKELKYRGECNFVYLQWYGDIDGDEKSDLIFSASTTSVYHVELLLSSIANKDEYVKKADEFSMGNCY